MDREVEAGRLVIALPQDEGLAEEKGGRIEGGPRRILGQGG